MVKTTKKLMLGSGCLLGFFGVLGLSTPTSALTYQEEIPVSFTFNRGVSISISASDLHIYNLIPGTSDDSNIITVTTTTNNVTGYTLTASAGDSTNASTNLVNGTNNFASIATNASQASLTTDNTWGYSISTNNGSTWSNYSGLPLYTAASWKELANVNTNGATSIKFKIGAKASAAQPSGDYTNVINFTATTNYMPTTIADLTYMQDFASLDSTDKSTVLSSMATGTQYQLMDNRDNKTYFISKLADGNVWMTQNLDHDIVTTQNFYNYANTDIGHGSTPNTSATWTASRTTYETGNTTWLSNTNDNYYIPESYDPGDLCWDGVIVDPGPTDYSRRLVACTDRHYHAGNYYTWTAAAALNSSQSYTTNGTSIDQSLCPAGWTLPKGGSNTDSGSFTYLVNQQGLTAGGSGNIHQSPTYFPYTSVWDGGSMVSLGMGISGTIMSSTVGASSWVYTLSFNKEGNLQSDGSCMRYQGAPIRCLVR